MTSSSSMRQAVESALQSLGASEYARAAYESTVLRTIEVDGANSAEAEARRLVRLAQLLDTQALSQAAEQLDSRHSERGAATRRLFDEASACWRSVITLRTESWSSQDGGVSPIVMGISRDDLGGADVAPELFVALRFAVSGILAERVPEVRLELERFSLSTPRDNASWREVVLARVVSAFLLLVRKGRGWNDIYDALASIEWLRAHQGDLESGYLASIGDASKQALAAAELVAFYHVAQLVTSVGDYLRDGAESTTLIMSRLDRHRSRAREAFKAAGSGTILIIADLLWLGARELAHNSIWTHLSGVGERVKDFGRLLAAQGRPNPVLELWPSQQKALRQNLLDPYKRAILVEMPTSAGKTLLAKFSIVQSRALNPHGTVAYVVPTRALVNQVTQDLRSDLSVAGLRVEQAIPAFELDPTEDQLLATAPDVLVATPEKLDLLVRRNHPCVQRVALIVADEAHNLRDGDRGARLEMLLAMIKRDMTDARFLLLSPFLPNDRELTEWLGDERALGPIRVDWKPSARIVGAVAVQGRGRNKRLWLETLPAASNVDVQAGRRIAIGPAGDDERNTIDSLTTAAAKAFDRRGAVLVLCRGPGTAETRSMSIAQTRERLPSDPARDAVMRYAQAELGASSALGLALERGVAFHHSGLSHELRWLVETLIKQGRVGVICGTTTLAQGVNFPISSVIVETLQKGDGELQYEDFWNIAGRAMMDTVGVVAFPVPDREKRAEVDAFLRSEAEEISSQLALLIERADEIVAGDFSINALFQWPALGPFLQFVAHALKTAGSEDLGVEVEDLLRASLVYRQAQRLGPGLAERLVRICRAYLAKVRGQADVLHLADQTGFATPSVLHLRRRIVDMPELRRREDWEPEHLFGRNVEPLTRRIQAIADLPEMRLGPGLTQPFNAQKIAEILRDWVNGASVRELADRHPIARNIAPEDAMRRFSKFLHGQLLGRASWGLGALEGMCLPTQSTELQQDAAAFVPSMVFFGVKSKEAVWLRMVGVPRVVADGLADQWRQSRTSVPTSYESIRDWVSSRTEAQLAQSLPSGSPMTPVDVRTVWAMMSGVAVSESAMARPTVGE